MKERIENTVAIVILAFLLVFFTAMFLDGFKDGIILFVIVGASADVLIGSLIADIRKS